MSETRGRRFAPPRRRRGRVAAGIVGVLVLLAGVAYGVGYALTGDTLPRNTTVQGVAVGDLTVDAAAEKLQTELAGPATAPLTLRAGDQTLTKTPEELGLAVDYRASVLQAGGQKSWDPRVILANLLGGAAHDAVVTHDAPRSEEAVRTLAEQADREPADAIVTMDKTTAEIQDAVTGLTVDVPATVAQLSDRYLDATEVDATVVSTEADITTEEAKQAVEKNVKPAMSGNVTLTVDGKKLQITPAMMADALTFKPANSALAVGLDEAKLSEEIRPALTKLGFKAPKDASFTFSGGRPKVVPSTNGTGIEPKELATTVAGLMVKESDREGTAKTSAQEASFTTADAEALGIKEITGEFTTQYPASAYRITNIGKSSRLINGTLLKPGEVFSMNKVLGPRTLARGWAAGGAIDGGKVVERMGGGISQTTTTTFNAIFFAGLEDIYHKPHSLYFSRYPMGREATLDYVSVDMKFRNNTKYGVLMQAFTNNPKVGGQGTVTVRVWSTKVYDVKASAPVRSNVRGPGPTIRDNSAVCTPQSAMSGFTVNYNRLFYQNGKLVRTEPFKWTYNSLQPRTCTNPNARRDRVVR